MPAFRGGPPNGQEEPRRLRDRVHADPAGRRRHLGVAGRLVHASERNGERLGPGGGRPRDVPRRTEQAAGRRDLPRADARLSAHGRDHRAYLHRRRRVQHPQRHRSYLIIPIVMTVFSFFGGAYGMAEEAIPFALIFVPLALALGYDSIVGVCLSFVAASVGFSAGFLNPFTVQISQGIAGVPLGSGIRYRLIVWAAATVVAIVWVMVYAARVKADPKRSIMYDLDQVRREDLGEAEAEQVAFTWRHGVCLLILAATVVGLIVGSTVYSWYMVEFAGLFFAMGLACGIAGGIGPNKLAKSFITGAKDLAGAALIVAFAGGIIVILEDGHILDTILYGMASVTSHFGGILAAQSMYVLQLILNFFIPSGSTKAVLTMPLLAPLADLSGITRQTLVLAYQLGAGFNSMILPTSAVTVGTLALAKIPYERWFKWNWPCLLYTSD